MRQYPRRFFQIQPGTLAIITLTALIAISWHLGPGFRAQTNAAQVDRATLEKYFALAVDALNQNQPATARKYFEDCLTCDPNHALSLQGIGYCHASLGGWQNAGEVFEKLTATPLSPDRSLMLNAASVSLTLGNHTRAISLIKDYLVTRPEGVDETVIDALCISLENIPRQERSERLYHECKAIFQVVNLQLEHTRPGHKRFGTQWISETQFEQITAENQQIQLQLDRIIFDATLIQERINRANIDIARLSRASAPNSIILSRQIAPVQSQLSADQMQIESARINYEMLASRLKRPTYPTQIPLCKPGFCNIASSEK